MGAENFRKSGQIPAFGDWENANELPITQYFECARQAGLLRCTCSGECPGAYVNNAAASYWSGAAVGVDPYGVGGYDKPLPRRLYAVPERKNSKEIMFQTRGMNRGIYSQSNEMRKQVKVRDLMTQPRNQPIAHKHNPKQSKNRSANLVKQKTSISAKPVDEDLYKIPPELLENSKRKRMLGFFSKCMVPPCAA